MDQAPTVTVAQDSVAATRTALERGGPVIGWVDVTSPNLVDLLHDLGSSGDLVGVRWSFVSGFNNDISVLRGLRTLADVGLAVRVEGQITTAAIHDSVPNLRFI